MNKKRVILTGLLSIGLVCATPLFAAKKVDRLATQKLSHTIKSPGNSQKTDKIDLNQTSDASAIAKAVKGIGKSRAVAIIAYRKQHGKFASLEDLSKVRGISPRYIKQNREHLLAVLRLS